MDTEGNTIDSQALSFVSPEKLAIVSQRKAVCRVCEHCKQINVLTVGCSRCGCSGVSLPNGKCPDGRWPDSQVFDRCYCVNLNRRADRWDEFQARVPDRWPFPVIERFPAIDGQQVKPPTWFKAGAGAWGCYRSHLAIIERCISDKVNSVLILEDDAIFRADFIGEVLGWMSHVPGDWEWMYFGGQHLKPPKSLNEHLVEAVNVNRTHAYALRGDGLKKVYDHLHQWESWKKTSHIDHHYGVLHSKMKVYAPAKRWFVGQAAGKSNIAGKDVSEQWWVGSIRRGKVLVEAEQKESRMSSVAVLGTYRGGTSCVAGVLHHLGVYMGHRIASEVRSRGDRYCTYEARMLRQICWNAFDEPTMTSKGIERDEIVRRLSRWMDSRRKEVEPTRMIGGKHPMLSLMTDELEIAWAPVKFIRVCRPFMDTVKSMKRDAWWPDQCEDAIKVLYTACERARQTCRDILHVDFYNLTENPASVIKEIVGFLGLEPDEAAIEKAVSFVNPELLHTNAC